jgi:hypothetical protein
MSKLEDKGLMERECAREACTSRPCVEVRPPMRQISTARFVTTGGNSLAHPSPHQS